MHETPPQRPPARLVRACAFALGLVALPLGFAGEAQGPKPSTLVGDLRIRTFTSKVFGDQQTLRVWLPPGYGDAANAHRTYPVLYMLDGQNLFDERTASFGMEWQVDETLTRLIGDGSVEPIVVVGIDSPGARRSDEYLPYPDPMEPSQEQPHGRDFPGFVAGEVIPRVAGEFRVSRDRAHVGIGGSSYGALAALYAVVHRPDLFGICLLESAPLHVGNGQLLRDVTPLVVGPVRAHIGVGGEEFMQPAQTEAEWGVAPGTLNTSFVRLSSDLADALRAARVTRTQVQFLVKPQSHHNERAWAERFPEAIRFLFPAQGR